MTKSPEFRADATSQSSLPIGDVTKHACAAMGPTMAQSRPTGLRASVNSPSSRLSPQEQAWILGEWNNTALDWADDVCLHTFVSRTAAIAPSSPAIICDDSVVSYRELDTRSTVLAIRLLQLGVRPGEVVSVVANHTAESIISLVAVLKAGAAYLPLDVQLPAERLASFADRAEVRFCVGAESPCQFSGDVQLVRPWLDQASDQGVQAQGGFTLPKVDPAGLAYVLFTSGSTGEPKGVMLDHRGPANTIRDINKRFGIVSEDRTISLSALGFDLSVYDLFGMFACGGTVVVPTLAQAKNPTAWLALISNHRVSVWNTVPALMDILATAAKDASQLKTLRTVMLSGDWIPMSLPDRIRTLTPNAKLWSLGGSTEASIWSVYYPIDSVDPSWKSIPYGWPLQNQRCYVVDEEMNLSPVGEAGELCIAGLGVAVGYFNDQTRTAQQFVANPFDGQGLLYRTGDLCRLDNQGLLEFLGRRDRQVKIRGYRIGLGEIESELIRHESVGDALTAVDTQPSGDRLVAYVRGECGPDNLPSDEELAAFLSSKLPEYMVPSAFVAVDKWPLTPNGKVDVGRLPKPREEVYEATADCTQTANWLSQTLADILRIERLPTDRNFYAAGGNSLAALALIARIQQSYGVQLRYQDILCRERTLASIADLIDGEVQTSSTHSAPNDRRPLGDSLAATPEHIEKTLCAPTSHQQQQMWVVNQINNQRSTYNVPIAYVIEGKVSVHALGQALDQIVDSQHILRTVYKLADDFVEQHVVERTAPILQASNSALQFSEDLANETPVSAFARATFDLEVDLPVRAKLFPIDNGSHLLVVVFHHIAVDGNSIGIFNDCLSRNYASLVNGQTPSDTTPATQYAQYAQWQTSHARVSNQQYLEDQTYWKQQLQTPPPPVSLPTDNASPGNRSSATVQLRIEGETLAGIREFSKSKQSTVFATILSAIKVLLFRYTSQSDLIVGTAVSTRDVPGIEDTIGYFIGVLPIRSQLSETTSFHDLCEQINATTVAAMSHRDFPYERMKAECDAAIQSADDLFNVLFVLEDQQACPVFGNAQASEVQLSTGAAKFDLLVAANESDTAIAINMEYDSHKFTEARLRQFSKHLLTTLQQCMTAPSTQLGALHLATKEDVWEGKSQAHATFENSRIGLSQRLRQACQENCDRVALRLGSRQHTYQALSSAANKIANQLRDAQVHPGDAVGIHLGRSPEMVAAVLATIQVGAVCVPLDPILPQQRIEQIVSSANARTVICNSDAPLSIQHTRISPDDAFSTAAANTVAKCEPHCHAPDDLIYILYTSGSTGVPKGVEMRMGVLDNLIGWQAEQTSVGRGGKTLQFASLGFDVSFQEILSTLTCGGELHLIEQATQRDLNALWGYIVEHRIERIFVPFVALSGLCEIAVQRGAESTLKEINTAGERLVITDAIRSFFQDNPTCRLVNQYGPTESHVVSSFTLPADVAQWPTLPPIGQPIPGAELAVVDRDGRLLPRGVKGELWIGESCIAKGYRGCPSQTGSRFIESTLSNFRSRRWYRTGDVCFVDWTGQLVFVDRNDDQVKVRGNRVELGEVESALLSDPQLTAAAVIADRRDQASHLVAFVTTRTNTQEPGFSQKLRARIAAKLPEYMVPAQVFVREELPASVNGKVDRKTLAQVLANAPSPSIDDRATQPIQESDSLANSIADIWSKVLRVEGLHAGSNFFDCGGNSLAAAIMFARLQTTLDFKVSMSTLAANPTLETFVDSLRMQAEKPTGTREAVKLAGDFGGGQPLYCLPGIDGHFLNFRDLAQLLGDQRPVLGLEPFGLTDSEEAAYSLEELASKHVCQLTQIHTAGTIHLVGFSFGGVLAYEMAQQLWQSRRDVSLSMIDATPGVPQSAPLIDALLFHAKYAATLQRMELLSYGRERLRAGWLGILHKFGRISLEERIRRIIDLDEDYGRVAAANMRALSNYKPRSSLGPATLYRASLRATGGSGADPTAGWNYLFSNHPLDVQEVDGAHANMLKLQVVPALAEHLSRRLSKLDSTS